MVVAVSLSQTCWAVFERRAINLRDLCIWLVDLFDSVIVSSQTPNVILLMKNVHWFSVALLTLKFIPLHCWTAVHYRGSWSPCNDLLWFIVVMLLSASLSLLSQNKSLGCPSISLNISFYYVGTSSWTVMSASQLVVFLNMQWQRAYRVASYRTHLL